MTSLKPTRVRLPKWKPCLILLACLLGTVLVATSAHAKESPANAIVLFDGPAGPAYVQVSGLMLNGKNEVRVCDGVAKISKSVYDGLQKIQLAGAASLQRNTDGTLALSTNSKSLCVVPANLKFDKNPEFTAAEAADQSVLQGTVISSSIAGGNLPPFNPGVRLVFVATPDDDLAQYLLAERIDSIASWQDFVNRHASSGHVVEAKNSLAGRYEQSAESAFAKYEKSSAGQMADIASLRQAEQQAIQANSVVAGYPAASKLRARINQELDALLQTDATRLQNFRTALADHAPGYKQLAAARRYTEELLSVNPEYAPVANLRAEIAIEMRKMEAALVQAEGMAAAKDYDQALHVLGPYRAFLSEVPRIGAISSAAYTVHFESGRQFAAEHNWEKAVAEFRRATEIRSDSPEASAALKDAELSLAAARDRQAAQQALASSEEYADNKDFIAAYETLAELPDSERVFVGDQLTALQKDFVPAASRRAQKLQEIHIPIHGRADEDAVQEAYELLNRASAITGDPALKLKLDLLSDKISVYYVDQARRYLNKPMGSGVGVGWLYLGEAERYKPNLEAVRDAMAQYASAYQLRSRLSIGVVLRDQTSRRESAGFTDQLADAIANGLESSDLSVKVVRQSNESAGGVQPNFLLIGEILEHRVVKEINLETLQSKYRAGTHDVKNEEWSKANDDYQSAQQALQTAQRALANAHGKKDVAAANEAVAAAQKNVDEARHKLDATEPARAQDIVQLYNYTKKNIDLTALVELNFHISDTQGNLIEAGTPIKKDNHKRFMVLENVKPEDTEGVKSQGTEPDEVQFLADAELVARDMLVKSVREKVLALPSKVLEAARNKAQQSDVDGAAEAYIVYLNATTDVTSAERNEAAKFLREHYNLGMTAADAKQKVLAGRVK